MPTHGTFPLPSPFRSLRHLVSVIGPWEVCIFWISLLKSAPPEMTTFDEARSMLSGYCCSFTTMTTCCLATWLIYWRFINSKHTSPEGYPGLIWVSRRNSNVMLTNDVNGPRKCKNQKKSTVLLCIHTKNIFPIIMDIISQNFGYPCMSALLKIIKLKISKNFIVCPYFWKNNLTSWLQ